MQRYWFKPARFWRWFAAYYPVTWEGWVVSAVCIATAVAAFIAVDRTSHSGSDTLIGVAPWWIGIGVVGDVFTRWKGEYPFWWRKEK